MRTDARVVIVGAGGHGKVVADALHRERPDAAFCFADDQPRLWGQTILGQEVLGRASDVLSEADWFHIAIGHNAFRAQAFEAMLAKAAAPLSIVHPSAHLSPFASVGRGAFLAAASVVAPSAKIGDAVIVNHGAIIDHDCDVGPYCHIAPGASLSGGVSLGPGVLVGTGARVLPGIRVGINAVIGAGAVVTRNVGEGEQVVGVPARNVVRERDAKKD